MALNYQTKDKLYLINKMRFKDNGGCGYVLKPKFLRDPNPCYSPIALVKGRSAEDKIIHVAIEVVSGQHIPKPDGELKGEVIDPYVKVRIRGHLSDKGLKGKTKTVRNNGFNPVWCERFGFRVNYPSLAFLELRVKDYSKKGSNKFLGAFICPLSMVQQGKKGW